MSHTSFYNDNANRSYPFLRGESFLAKSAVVDCGFSFGPNSGFTHGTSQVYLAAVIRQADWLRFVFRTTAANLSEKPLVFVRHVTDAPYRIEYIDTQDNQSSSSVSESVDCDYADDFLGYLVTGPLELLLQALPGDGELTGHATVEPALLHDMSAAYARTINIANGDRTRYETPDNCRPQCWTVPPQPIWIAKRCVQGALRFSEGFNLRLTQDADDNSVKFDALVGAGAGEPCEQVPLYPGEPVAANSLFYEAGPACNEVIRSINGVGGRLVNIRGGVGVRVTSFPERHRVTINVDTHDMAVCTPALALPSLSEISVSEDPCQCGPAQ